MEVERPSGPLSLDEAKKVIEEICAAIELSNNEIHSAVHDVLWEHGLVEDGIMVVLSERMR